MDQSAVSTEQAQHVLATMIPMIGLFAIIGFALIIVPLWIAFKKAGLAPALSLLVIVPFGPIIVLYILAFARWKVVPAPEFAAYPPNYPPPPGYPPASGYTATGAYTLAQNVPVSSPDEPRTPN